jgi:hypothetical protein
VENTALLVLLDGFLDFGVVLGFAVWELVRLRREKSPAATGETSTPAALNREDAAGIGRSG